MNAGNAGNGVDFPERTVNRVRGFTLMEVLLAVALSAVLLTVVYWTYFSINRSVSAATENEEALETGRMLSELLKKDIRGICSPDRFSLKARNEIADGHSLGWAEFVTTAGFNRESLKLRRIGYELVADDRGRKVLVRRESTRLNEALDNTASVFELSRIVNGFRFEFYNGTDWVDGWDSDSVGGFPKQVRVTFDVADAKGNDKRFVAEESIQSAIQ